jgi:hypothetical protein
MLTLLRHQLVIVHPMLENNLTRSLIQQIQNGADPNDPADDIMVLAYVTAGMFQLCLTHASSPRAVHAGEDDRTIGMTADEMLRDPRFVGDGTGPRVDPRGRTPRTSSLRDIDPLGVPSPGGTGFASFYVDDNSVALGRPDGIPDINTIFGTSERERYQQRNVHIGWETQGAHS